MKASTRPILSSDREPHAQTQARYTSEWTDPTNLIMMLLCHGTIGQALGQRRASVES